MSHKITVIGPKPKWGTAAQHGTKNPTHVVFQDEEHVPMNMLPSIARRRDAHASLDVTTNAAGAWVEVTLTEYTTNKSGHRTSRAVSMTLYGEHVQHLVEFLQKQQGSLK